MVVPLNKPVVCPIVIGRTTELIAIHQLIESTKCGQGQVALLSGEAGIGKSRLVKEAKAYATHSMCVLQGNCFESDQSYPRAPVLDLLHTFFITHALKDFLQSSYEQAIALFRKLDDRNGLTSSLATLALGGPTY